MRLPPLSFALIVVVGLRLEAAVRPELPAAAEAPAPAPFEKVIFDRADFIRRLPEKTLISYDFADSLSTPRTYDGVEAALKKLGQLPGVEFIRLPAGVLAPKVKHSLQPIYPRDLRQAGVRGDADYLVLVNAAGEVGALYCLHATDPRFAVAGAKSLVRWTFTPAVYGKMKVSVLTVIPIAFAL